MKNRSDNSGLVPSEPDKNQELRSLRFLDCQDGAIEWARPIAECGAAAKRTFGVDDTGTLSIRLITQVMKVMSPLGEHLAAAEGNDAAQLLHGIAPQDAVEGMLAVQMVATHNAAMRCVELASHPDQTIQGIETN